jgi:hypothetical protein
MECTHPRLRYFHPHPKRITTYIYRILSFLPPHSKFPQWNVPPPPHTNEFFHKFAAYYRFSHHIQLIFKSSAMEYIHKWVQTSPLAHLKRIPCKTYCTLSLLPALSTHIQVFHSGMHPPTAARLPPEKSLAKFIAHYPTWNISMLSNIYKLIYHSLLIPNPRNLYSHRISKQLLSLPQLAPTIPATTLLSQNQSLSPDLNTKVRSQIFHILSLILCS